jgi:hypothetical protein
MTEILSRKTARGTVTFGQKDMKTLTVDANAFAGRAEETDGFPSQTE